MTNEKFVENVRRIAASDPTYREGGDGGDGTCDCIGLVMGALGGSYPMHSTNWFARYMVDNLSPASDYAEDEFDAGQLVFKARDPNNPRYDLNDRYKAGGRYDTGDLTDYYHVGVVTSVYPFGITHCTSSDDIDGIDYDDSMTGWTHVANVKGMEFVNADDDEPASTPAKVQTTIVQSPDGKPVRLRSTPTTEGNYNTIIKVNAGETVEVLEAADEWATVRWQGTRGYMMREFLRLEESTPSEPAPVEDVTITLSVAAAEELMAALRRAGVG